MLENEQEESKEQTEQADAIVLQGLGSSVKRQYKIVGSLLEFQVIIHQYVTLARSFGPLASEISSRLKEILLHFNEMVCQDILGAEAVTKQKIQHINARHLCKSPS